MSKKLYVLTTISILTVCLYVFLIIPPKKQHPLNTSYESTAEADAPDDAIRFEIFKTKDPATGTVPVERLAFARQVQLQKFDRQRQLGKQPPVPGISWNERGPDSVGGRTRALMYDKNDATRRKVWAGGVGGGLWYTNDITAANVAWTKVSDTFNNLAVTAIAQSGNLMAFATGEGWANPDGIRGNGIWRSIDGGVNWEHLELTKNNPIFWFVQDLAFLTPVSGGCSSADPRLLASTLFGGVQVSLDTGKNWSKSLGNGTGGGNMDAAADLEQEYYYVYATLGLVGNPGGGIFRSCDGVNWDKVYQAAGDEERIELSVHYQLAYYAYALVMREQGNVRRIKRIMKTDEIYPPPFPPTMPTWTDVPTFPTWCDNGATNTTDFTRTQGWYDLIVAVQPIFNNHENVFIGGVDIFKSANSGGLWTQLSQWAAGCPGKAFVHADIHNIIFRPDGLGGYLFNDILVATDGGIFRSTDGGTTFTSRNKTYNVTQFYTCTLDPDNVNYILGGTQDNGVRKFTTANLNNTTNIHTNDFDGGFCHIDVDNPLLQIASATNNNYFISTNGGTFTYSPRNNRGLFVNPTDYDDGPNILYCGDAPGAYYRWTNPFATLDTAVVNVMAFNGRRVTHVRVSPTVANRVYFGMDNGAIVQVDDAHTGNNKTGVVIRPDIAAGIVVSSIAIQNGNENHMLVTYSNYGATSVYESSPGTGGSLDWRSVEGDLPDMPVRWAIFDPRNSDWAILATEKGIWSTDNLNSSGTTDWEPTNNNFANTRVDMLDYRAMDGMLAAATHGRGLFTTIIPAAAVPVTLLDFRGNLKGNNITLYWQTATEQHSKGFEIERSTGNGFTRIGYVAGAGNSNTLKQYAFDDKDIAQQNNYYRLKQIDEDGNYEYSKTILIKNPLRGNAVFTVLNNPFRNSLDLQFGAALQGKAAIRLLDVTGQVVMRWNGNVQPGNRMRLQVADRVPGGLYIVQLFINDRQYAVPVRKE